MFNLKKALIAVCGLFYGDTYRAPSQMQVNYVQQTPTRKAKPAQAAPQEMSIEQKVARFNEIFATDPANRTDEETQLMKKIAPEVNEYQKKKILGQLGAETNAKPSINNAAAPVARSPVNKPGNDKRGNATENTPDEELTIQVAENIDDSEFGIKIITLIDEGGKEHEFELEAILDVEEEKYAVLIPMNEEYAGNNEAVIMRLGLDENGDEVVFDIENDEEWDKVADAYDKILEELT